MMFGYRRAQQISYYLSNCVFGESFPGLIRRSLGGAMEPKQSGGRGGWRESCFYTVS